MRREITKSISRRRLNPAQESSHTFTIDGVHRRFLSLTDTRLRAGENCVGMWQPGRSVITT